MNCILINKPRRSITYDFPNTESTPTSVPSLYKSVSCNTSRVRHHRKGKVIKTVESFHSSEEEIKYTVNKNHTKAVIKTKLKVNKATLIKRPRIFVNNTVKKQKPVHHNCTCIDCLCKGTNTETIFNEENRNIHASDCICVSCLCKTDEAEETIPSKHGADCSCVECLYLNKDVKNEHSGDSLHQCMLSEDYHPANCECPSCLTSPASPIKLPVELSKHDSNCGCVKCVFNKKNQQSTENLDENQENIQIDDYSICLETKSTIPETTKSAGQMAMIITKNNDEITQILDKIRIACKEADQLKKCNSLEKQENLEKTLGTLQKTFEKLQSQCKHMNAKVNCLKNNLLEKATSDSNNCGDKNICETQCNTINTNKCILDEKSVQEELVNNPDEMEVTEARRISSNSLLLLWTPGKFTQKQVGYEILANGFIKSRVYSSFRTCAVLHDLDFKSNIHISIYAVSIEGRLQPPARALFEIG